MRTARKLIACSALAATLGFGSVLASAAPASARAVSAGAAIECRTGQVLAYPPNHNLTRTNTAYADLKTRSFLYRWNASTRHWDYVQTTGWWANAGTNQNGYIGAALGQYWVTNGGMGAVFKPLNVRHSHYFALTTEIFDSKDGTTVSVLDRVNPSDSSSSYFCYA